MEIKYRGTDRKGAGVTGTLPDPQSMAAFVERKYRQGWQFLSVTCDGREIAGIQRSRFRPGLWWSE